MASFAWQDVVEAIEKNDTSFGTRIADRTVNRLDIPSTYTANTERHKLIVNGTEVRDFVDPAFTDQPGKYQLTAADGDTIAWASRERLRYVPNYEALWGIAAWYETAADQLSGDQRLFVELSDDARDNVYGYEFTPGNTRIRMLSGGTLVDERTESEWGDFPDDRPTDRNPFDFDAARDEPLNPRAFVTWYGVGPARTTLAHSGDEGNPRNPTLGYLANNDDVATEEINLRLRVVADADAGAAEFTVNVASMGALVRGGAIKIDRPKSGILYDLGGSIGDTWADNDPLLAVRHDSKKRNVTLGKDVPAFSPAGDSTIELLVGAVAESETDASEFAPYQQTQGQNSALEATTNVSTFPTATRNVPKGSAQVEVPAVRQLALSVAESARVDPTQAEAGPGEDNKRVLGPDEVALYIPRTAPGQTGASIDWLRPVSKQDW